MRGLFGLIMLCLCTAKVHADTICGRAAPNIRLGMMAFMAHAKCPGILEINDRALGRLGRIDGVDIKRPACERDLAKLVHGWIGAYDESPATWCALAAAAMQSQTVTRALLPATSGKADPCNALDEAAGIVSSAVRVCSHTLTEAGAVIRDIGAKRPACLERFEREHDTRLGAVQSLIMKGDRKRAVAFFCRDLLSSHVEQMKEFGMKAWFAPAR